MYGISYISASYIAPCGRYKFIDISDEGAPSISRAEEWVKQEARTNRRQAEHWSDWGRMLLQIIGGHLPKYERHMPDDSTPQSHRRGCLRSKYFIWTKPKHRFVRK
jgi:hypothetical protein